MRWFSRITWRVIRMICSASRLRRWAAAGGRERDREEDRESGADADSSPCAPHVRI
jgi:hypothetical protein